MASLKENLESLQIKAKERTVKTQNVEYDLETLVKKINKKTIKLNPDYQRNHRWEDDVSSRLIESLILNIPVPIIYLSQDIDVDEEIDEDFSRYSVIDGQQRLTAIYEFFKNKYSLTGLTVLKELNGSTYNNLPPFLIRRLEERTIKCLRIDSTLDSKVKYDIFERLNSGAVKLEPQELRNATCRGPFNSLIKELAKNEDFITIAKLDPQGVRVKKMEDQELVVRFFSLTHNDGYKDYKGGFKGFLTQKMEVFNKLTLEAIEEIKNNFLKTIKLIRLNMGDEPFAKYRYEGGKLSRMSKFNVSVYDVVIVLYSKVNSGNISIVSDNQFRELFKNDDFFTSIEGSVNDVSKLSKRIALALRAGE